jgi:endonuclease YncB( thermonuclease family)
MKLLSAVATFLIAYQCLAGSASGASLYGTVKEISDGDTFTIICLKRPLKIRLMAIAAPELDQAYGDVAKQHLQDLISDKFVSVEYSSLGLNGLIIGKVTWNEMDVGAQMVRDGVAWYDKSFDNRLTDIERQIYAHNESAARDEKRGLWQDKSPIAPWEFKQRQLERRPTVASKQPTSAVKYNPKRGDRTFLGRDDLLRGLTGATAESDATYSAFSSAGSEWRKVHPEGEHFSALMPGKGFEYSKNVPTSDGQTATFNYWMADYQGVSYVLMSCRGPNARYTDSLAIDETIRGLLLGLNRGFERRGINLSFEATYERKLRLGGFAGSQYSLSSGEIKGLARVFSKQLGTAREIYLVGALNGKEGNPSVDEFLRSFTIRNDP